MYLIVAAVCFLLALGALAVAAFFQLGVWTPAPQKSLPSEYAATSDSLDLSIVDAHFAKPYSVRFVVTIGTITQPLTGQEILGYFDATTANGLADYPDDFDIIGGKNADLFNRVSASNAVRRAGLQPAAALVSQVNQTLSGLKTTKQRSFQIQVIARDSFGNLSEPTLVTVGLWLAPANVQAPSSDVSPMQQLARDIALIVDPVRTPAYFDAYNRALRVPSQCRADSDDVIFVANFRRAFEHVRSRLKSGNIEELYRGVCDGWSRILDQVAAAQTARQSVAIENASLKFASQLAKETAVIARNSTLLFAGGAFVFFMWISLSLAFLSIENHTRAMREAMESAANKENR